MLTYLLGSGVTSTATGAATGAGAAATGTAAGTAAGGATEAAEAKEQIDTGASEGRLSVNGEYLEWIVEN